MSGEKEEVLEFSPVRDARTRELIRRLLRTMPLPEELELKHRQDLNVRFSFEVELLTSILKVTRELNQLKAKVEVVEKLLGESDLVEAVEAGELAILERLIEEGAPREWLS